MTRVASNNTINPLNKPRQRLSIRTAGTGISVVLAVAMVTGVPGAAIAEQLYQWQEADGSLTFSPEPPAATSGIAYTIVNPGSPKIEAQPPTPVAAPAAPADRTHAVRLPDTGFDIDAAQRNTRESLETVVLRRQTEAVTERPEVAAVTAATAAVQLPAQPPTPLPKVILTPAAGGNGTALSEGISAASPLSATLPRNSLVETEDQPGPASNATVNATKQRRCTQLKKRIVALEHNMASASTAEAMDQSVMQIAVYQRSYNDHCNRLAWR